MRTPSSHPLGWNEPPYVERHINSPHCCGLIDTPMFTGQFASNPPVRWIEHILICWIANFFPPIGDRYHRALTSDRYRPTSKPIRFSSYGASTEVFGNSPNTHAFMPSDDLCPGRSSATYRWMVGPAREGPESNRKLSTWAGEEFRNSTDIG